MLRTIALAFSYTDAVPVIREADLHLRRGWAGLVGQNGSGKSVSNVTRPACIIRNSDN